MLAREPALAAKATHTGNPVRPAVVEAAKVPYRGARPDRAARLLVFGGSQGARIMADIVPPAVELSAAARCARVSSSPSRRAARTSSACAPTYARLGIAGRESRHSLPTCRRASRKAISWCAARAPRRSRSSPPSAAPPILVPLPHALDQDQLANAAVLEKAGGAIRIDQAGFTPDKLASEIARIAAEPERLAVMAQRAPRQAGALDAADRLAELVLRVAGLEARG